MGGRTGVIPVVLDLLDDPNITPHGRSAALGILERITGQRSKAPPFWDDWWEANKGNFEGKLCAAPDI